MINYAYGKNVVLQMIKNQKPIEKILLTSKVLDSELKQLFTKQNITYQIVERRELDQLTNNQVHQGIVALIEEYRLYQLSDIISKDNQSLLVMLDGLNDPHNLGAILRTCDATKVDGVIIGKNRSVGLNGTVAKVSTGAIHHVKVAQVTNLTRTLEDLKKKAFWVVGCELENSQDYRSVDYNMPTVLVIGSEGFGMSRLVKKSCDINVVLPMVGHVNSLNASVAASVLLYQVYNSRHPL